jgi:hypothetical protein
VRREKPEVAENELSNTVWLFGPWVARFWFHRVVWRGGKDEGALETWFVNDEKRRSKLRLYEGEF